MAKHPEKHTNVEKYKLLFTQREFSHNLSKHWRAHPSPSFINTDMHTHHFSTGAKPNGHSKERLERLDSTHLIKVEQHFSPIQLISLQTHSLVHQQLPRNTQETQAGYEEQHTRLDANKSLQSLTCSATSPKMLSWYVGLCVMFTFMYLYCK